MSNDPNTHNDAIVKISAMSVQFKNQHVLNDINLEILQNEIFGIVGGSGSGKTTLLRTILMLQKITSGSIQLFNQDIQNCSEKQAIKIQRRWGVMFQKSALFSSLTVLENVLFPLHTQTNLSKKLQKELGYLKIALTGLPIEAASKYPSELSGGMQKRAALARAIVLDPELLLLDEPTAGLDPQSAEALDQLILDLRKALKLTIIMVTHDIDSLWRVTDRVAFLADGKILAALPISQLVKDHHPAIQKYFSGQRANRAKQFSDNLEVEQKNKE